MRARLDINGPAGAPPFPVCHVIQIWRGVKQGGPNVILYSQLSILNSHFLHVSSPRAIHLPPISASQTCFMSAPTFVNVSRAFIVIGPMCESPS